uniref:Folliculin/SMCR8 longin domain-containing protein n=2 Tax=Lepeophtheirus salmonis TaxID=72036 RepID=A0A0K2TXU1_LEPSM
MNNAILGVVHYCEFHGPQPIFITESVLTPLSSTTCNTTAKPGVVENACILCQTIPKETGYFVSQDKQLPSLHFLSSTPWPDEENDSYKLLKHVAIRITSIEGFRDVISGENDLDKGGPFLIGDEAILGGRTLFAFTFCLRDLASRGQKRIYSIFILLHDHFWLLQSINFIYGTFKQMSMRFQSKANELFDTQDSSKLKNLSHLLGDENLYVRLHRQFIGILKIIGKNFQDTIHHGQPLEDIYVSNKEKEELGYCDFKEIFDLLEPQNQKLLIYRLLTNRGVVIYGENMNQLAKVLSLLSIFLPHHSHAKLKSNSSGSLGILDGNEISIHLNTNMTFSELNSYLPSPLPVLVLRIINILQKTSYLNGESIHKHILHLREEIFGLSKLYYIIQFTANKDKLKTVLRAMNLSYSDKEVLEIWSQYLRSSFRS